MVRANVDDKYDFLIEKIKDQFMINGAQKTIDVQKINESSFHFIYNQKSFKVRIENFDSQEKTMEIKVNQHLHTVKMLDENDLLLERMGMKEKQEQKINFLKAPMPGLIVDIKVKEGQHVEKHDHLVTLKAMKMENILKSPSAGVIKKILVEKNQKIEKDAVILQF